MQSYESHYTQMFHQSQDTLNRRVEFPDFLCEVEQELRIIQANNPSP
jgi:hypothetical protein